MKSLLRRNYLAKWIGIGVLIGVMAGVGAILFYVMIQIVTNSMLGAVTGFYPPNPAGETVSIRSGHPNFLLVPISGALGGLITGLLVYTLAPEAEGHGTDVAISAFHHKEGRIRKESQS